MKVPPFYNNAIYENNIEMLLKMGFHVNYSTK